VLIGRRSQTSAQHNFSRHLRSPARQPKFGAMTSTLPEETRDASRQPRSSAFLPEHIRVVRRMTRLPEQRPVDDAIDNIANWLLE